MDIGSIRRRERGRGAGGKRKELEGSAQGDSPCAVKKRWIGELAPSPPWVAGPHAEEEKRRGVRSRMSLMLCMLLSFSLPSQA